MRQSNGCSTPAPRSSEAKQWFQQLAQKKKNQVHALNADAHLSAALLYYVGATGAETSLLLTVYCIE